MSRPSASRRARRRLPLLALALAAAASACRRNPVLIDTPAVCDEPSSPPAQVAPADTLFRLELAVVLSKDQARHLEAIEDQPGTARVLVGRLAPDAEAIVQPGNRVAFTVAPGRTFTVLGDATMTTGTDYRFWTGKVDAENGGADLVLTSLGVTGELQSYRTDGHTAYSFQPLGGGLEAIVCVDMSRMPID
jgi:hypothetical protein